MDGEGAYLGIGTDAVNIETLGGFYAGSAEVIPSDSKAGVYSYASIARLYRWLHFPLKSTKGMVIPTWVVLQTLDEFSGQTSRPGSATAIKNTKTSCQK